jgi:hypothetical protein
MDCQSTVRLQGSRKQKSGDELLTAWTVWPSRHNHVSQ